MKYQTREVKKGNRKEKQLERDLRECMKCHDFWGNDNRCVNSNCIKKEIPKKVEVDECTNCPYRQNERYCFPCMKKILGKE